MHKVQQRYSPNYMLSWHYLHMRKTLIPYGIIWLNRGRFGSVTVLTLQLYIKLRVQSQKI